jgi:uncharacterized protein
VQAFQKHLSNGRLHLQWRSSLVSAPRAVVAILYAAVGQAGGTGYIAVMGLIGLPPNVIKPTALALNILVAAIDCVRFYRAGLLTWKAPKPAIWFGTRFAFRTRFFASPNLSVTA